MASIFSMCNTCLEATSPQTRTETESQPSYFLNRRKQKIYVRHWHPPVQTPAKCVVYICHGVAEHCLRYGRLIKALTSRGCLVVSNDHVGHGRSDGERAQINKFSDYTEDVSHYLYLVKAKFLGLKIFGIGHSMGGSILIHLTMDHPQLLSGLVLIAPAVMPNPRTATPVKIALAKAVAYLRPSYQVDKMNPEWLSRDRDVVTHYTNDTLVYHGGLKARWCVEMLKRLAVNQQRLGEVRTDLLILQGDEDMLCLVDGAKLLHQEAGARDKTLKIYPGAYHQLHSEVEAVACEVCEHIAQWLEGRANK